MAGRAGSDPRRAGEGARAAAPAPSRSALVPDLRLGSGACLIPRIEQLQDRGDGRILSASPLNGYTVAVLDRGYLEKDLLPQLVERHFRLSQDPSVYVGIYGPGIAFSAPGGQVPAALRTAPDVTDDDMFEIRFFEFRRFVTDRRLEPPPARRPSAGTTAPATGQRAARPRRPAAEHRDRRPRGPRQRVPRPRRSGRAGRSGRPRGTRRRAALERARAAPRRLARHRRVARAPAQPARQLRRAGAARREHGAACWSPTGRARRLAAQQMEFVAGVSHELRTPLAVIRSAAENLADGVVADPKQVKRYGDVIAGEGRRLTDMVEQVMEFAGFESGRATLDVRPADLGGIIEEALRGADPLVREHHAHDRAARHGRAAGGAGRSVARSSRSLQNLIVNALKYGGGAAGRRGRRAPRRGRRAARSASPISDNGARHRRPRSAAHLRAVLPRRRRHGAPDPRQRPRPEPGEADHGRTRRPHHGAHRGRQGQRVHAAPAAGAGRRAGRRPAERPAARRPGDPRVRPDATASTPAAELGPQRVRSAPDYRRGADPHRRRRTRAGAHADRSARARGLRASKRPPTGRDGLARASQEPSTCSCST